MNLILAIFTIAPLTALFCYLIKPAARWIALASSAIILLLSGLLLASGETYFHFMGFRAYNLSSGIFLAAAFMTLMVVIYSIKFMEEHPASNAYYCYILLTLWAASGALFAEDYLTFLVFWGIMAITLYLLIGLGGAAATSAAKKTMIIVGGADAVMIMGIGMVFAMTRTMVMGALPIEVNGWFPTLAFICLLAGAFSKAGVMPLHSWIPDSSESAPTPVMAFLPASLDKLLGIYFLVRLTTDIFRLTPQSFGTYFLLIIGSLTIIVAVLCALMQHDLRKLLSFHAVSQVGYMVLGIASGTVVGIAGALFHMFNNAIYKSCLFLCGGAVEKKCGTNELGELGGLAKYMPFTFTATLIAALSISGIPPFNGFFSKWMIYQGLVEMRSANPYWIVWLTAAVFGSAFTLASFVKLIHAIFLGQGSDKTTKAREVSAYLLVPMLTLAGLCIILGVFAYILPLRYLLLPTFPALTMIGFWQPTKAAGLLILGLLLGVFIYLIYGVKSATSKPVFHGGEVFKEEEIKVSGVDFYDTIRRLPVIARIGKLAERKWFDIYELGTRLTFGLSEFLGRLHDGLVHTYLAWCLIGTAIVIMFLYFVK